MINWFQKRLDLTKSGKNIFLKSEVGSVQGLQNHAVILGQIQYSYGLKRGIEIAEQILTMISLGISEENIRKFLDEKKQELSSEISCV
jgi:hypothetical protein